MVAVFCGPLMPSDNGFEGHNVYLLKVKKDSLSNFGCRMITDSTNPLPKYPYDLCLPTLYSSAEAVNRFRHRSTLYKVYDPSGAKNLGKMQG